MLKRAFSKFFLVSGMRASEAKSHLYCSLICDDLKQQLLNELGLAEGNLPMSYLGVPLISTRLKKFDCHYLIEKLLGRINYWRNRNLSYGGRLQLINSVLLSIQSYWGSLFVIPKVVFQEVNTVPRNFLWKGIVGSSAGAKVPWEAVPRPKEEGGPGIKGIVQSNKAMNVKHIWHLFRCKGNSLWVNWVHCYHLKRRSFWFVKIPLDCAWYWRKLLKYRIEMVKILIFGLITGTQEDLLWKDVGIE